MRIRSLRRRRALTQDALAQRAGVSRTYLARLELGQHDPTLSTLEALARALRVTVERLIR